MTIGERIKSDTPRFRGKTIIAGSRSQFIPRHALFRICRGANLWPTEIVSGASYGIDRCGELFGDYHTIPVTKFPADWETLGLRAGPVRNAKMADYADVLIAIWDGKSLGTLDMIRNMVLRKKPFHVELWLQASSITGNVPGC